MNNQGRGIGLRASAFRTSGIPARESESVAALSRELVGDFSHHIKKNSS